MLRARWRELETEPRTRLNGHEGGNPGYGQADVLTGHRASSRPYIFARTCFRALERPRPSSTESKAEQNRRPMRGTIGSFNGSVVIITYPQKGRIGPS